MRYLILITLFFYCYQPDLFSCTVFFATDGIYVLGGNNEDWSDPNTKFWFIPANNGNYGWIKFGFSGGYPQGGMNDQGVFWDATACTYLAMPYSEKHKEKFNGPLMQKVMEECVSVDEAIMIFKKYYCNDLYNAQYLIGDKSGKSIIVEGDSIIIIDGNYQVMTNFYHSHPELVGYPCWRYEKATEILKSNNSISEYLFGYILSATHQEGKYPTQYSQIYNLKDGIIYLFHHHNYEEFINMRLSDELTKGYRDFQLPSLFSNIEILSPLDNQLLNSPSVRFSWRGNETSRYELFYSEDSTFSEYEASTMSSKNQFEGLFPVLISTLFGIFFLIGLKRGLNFKILMTMGIITFFMILSCNDELTTPDENNIIEFQQTINNLESNKTYYWRIVASPDGNPGFKSETIVYSFRTTN